MKVKELIELLKKQDQEMVVRATCDGTYTEFSDVVRTEVDDGEPVLYIIDEYDWKYDEAKKMMACVHPSSFIQGGKRVCGVCHVILPERRK